MVQGHWKFSLRTYHCGLLDRLGLCRLAAPTMPITTVLIVPRTVKKTPTEGEVQCRAEEFMVAMSKNK